MQLLPCVVEENKKLKLNWNRNGFNSKNMQKYRYSINKGAYGDILEISSLLLQYCKYHLEYAARL